MQSISELCPDVLITVENARPYLSQSPYNYGKCIDDLRQQVTCINRNNLKISLDVGHLFVTSTFHGYDLKDAVNSIKHLVVHTHIHDNLGKPVHQWEKQQTHQLAFVKGDCHMPVVGQYPHKGYFGHSSAGILRPPHDGASPPVF